ncbi:MAG: 16S rRNA (guanine(527)-N(7))-methyltransferase RsmG [Dehalococcoidia bacterium]
MQLLARGAPELGLDLTGYQLDQFEVYYRELADWNQRMNLTSITAYDEVQVKHFLDSLTFLLAAPGGPDPGQRVIDLGAGAGFPGVPLKLVFPDLSLTLVDSVGKKTGFLHHLVDTLSLSGVEVLTGRAEELGHREELRESFDWALARGLARMPVLLEYTLPFCRTGGKVVAWKHGGIEGELHSAALALTTLGGRYIASYPVAVTGLTDNRILVAVEKVGATPAVFPRRPGVPAKQPI